MSEPGRSAASSGGQSPASGSVILWIAPSSEAEIRELQSQVTAELTRRGWAYLVESRWNSEGPCWLELRPRDARSEPSGSPPLSRSLPPGNGRASVQRLVELVESIVGPRRLLCRAPGAPRRPASFVWCDPA